MKNRPLIAAATAALAMSMLAACSTGGNVDPGDVNGDVVPRELVWLTARSETSPSVSTVKTIAEDYAKDHPGFKLTLMTTADRPSYLQKLETLAAANQLPDFFDIDATPYAQKLKDKGVMVDMNKLIDELDVRDQFRPQALSYQTFADGSLAMLPLEFDQEYFWYNTNIFAEAGVSIPATLEEFPAMCGKLKAAGVTPISVTGPEGWPLQRYLSFLPFRQTGNEYIEKLRIGDTSMGDAVGSAASEWVASLGDAGCFSPDVAAQSYTDARDAFTQGKAAVYYIGTWELPTLMDEAALAPSLQKGGLDFFTLPTSAKATTEDNDFYFHSGIGFALNSTKFDALTKDFVSYIVDHYPALYAQTGQFSPIVGDGPVEPKYDSPLYQRLSDELDQLGDTLVRPWDTMLDPATNSRMQEDLPLLVQGGRSPAEFADDIDQSVRSNASSYFAG